MYYVAIYYCEHCDEDWSLEEESPYRPPSFDRCDECNAECHWVRLYEEAT